MWNDVWMKCRHRSNRARSTLTMAAACVAMLAISAACSGCLWIAIPSLAYEGYKYESGSRQDGQAKQHQSPQPPANDDVE